MRHAKVGNLGEITYTASEGCDGLTLSTTSPFHSEECYYNSEYQLLTRIQDENVEVKEYSTYLIYIQSSKDQIE